jgi:hypothetical protein
MLNLPSNVLRKRASRIGLLMQLSASFIPLMISHLNAKPCIRANLKAANERAAAALRLDKKRFALEQHVQITKQRDQIIELCRIKLYSEEQAKRRLEELDAREAELDRSSKRVRVRSPSPSPTFFASSNSLLTCSGFSSS